MKARKGTKRPIDRIRDGAGSFDLSTTEDDSEISGMISVGGRLLVVKGKGIYEVKLADQVDPERTNIGIPNTIQRLLPFGSDHPWVGAVILTAHGLLNRTHLPEEIDCDGALVLVLDIAHDIASMYELIEQYIEEQEAAIRSLDPKIQKDRSVVIPTIGNVAGRCKEFLQKADHALRKLFEVVQFFYTDVGPGGWTGLKATIDGGPQDLDNFSQFLRNALPLLQLVRNSRNCVEHPRQEQRIEVVNFSVDARNNLVPPTIEVYHAKTAQEKMPVADFMVHVSQQIVEVVEVMVVFLCARHVQSSANLPVQVVEIPSKLRRTANVRYGYGVVNGDQIIPMS